MAVAKLCINSTSTTHISVSRSNLEIEHFPLGAKLMGFVCTTHYYDGIFRIHTHIITS